MGKQLFLIRSLKLGLHILYNTESPACYLCKKTKNDVYENYYIFQILIEYLFLTFSNVYESAWLNSKNIQFIRYL